MVGNSVDRARFPDIQRDDIVLGESLGVGTFGAVFRGNWVLADGTRRSVALKKVFVLEKEAEILSKIRHKNIIQFYGICKTGSDFFIVTECADNGSLYDHIHSSEQLPYTLDTVVKWAVQIARGIQYLHYDAVDTIIHRDLKSKNVVLDKHLTCKICDFGTSKDLTHSCTAPTWGGTAAWMSPEMILQSDGITRATDVWSYGVVLWEILSREVPYKDHTEFRIFSLITQNGITLAIPGSCPVMLKQLMTSCWKMNPKERITMREILGKIEDDRRIMSGCLELEDWREEIRKQERVVERIRKDLEKRREVLEIRERALSGKRGDLGSAHHPPPDDVHQWNEHHTSEWIGRVLSRVASADRKFLERIHVAVFRNRITGARLLDTSPNDLENLGVCKLGSRIELMKEIRRLRNHQITLCNFPTLQQANRMASSGFQQNAPSPIPIDTKMVIVLGVYSRKIGNRRRIKFYTDSDCEDLERDATRFIQSVCFSVIDVISRKPLNEPMCSVSSGMTATPVWITVEEDVGEVKCIANIYFADEVTQPRNTEISVIVGNLDNSRIITEKRVVLKFRRSSSSSNQSSESGGYQKAQLRGFWQKKATLDPHVLTEIELSSLQENLKTLLPKSADRGTSGEDGDLEHSRVPTRKPVIHGGKEKWNWKEKKRKYQ